MRDPNRMNKVLDVLWKNWLKVPDWRFCQLIENIQCAAGGDLFYMEDEDFMELVNNYFGDINCCELDERGEPIDDIFK